MLCRLFTAIFLAPCISSLAIAIQFLRGPSTHRHFDFILALFIGTGVFFFIRARHEQEKGARWDNLVFYVIGQRD